MTNSIHTFFFLHLRLVSVVRLQSGYKGFMVNTTKNQKQTLRTGSFITIQPTLSSGDTYKMDCIIHHFVRDTILFIKLAFGINERETTITQ